MSAPALADPVIWQDVECGGYTDDLALWARLAAELDGPVLELGCGCGRVALHLAREGHEVTGIDSEPALVQELRRRAADEGSTLQAEVADAAGFSLGRRFGLVLAPMQVLQLLGEDELATCLGSVAGHLRPGGMCAAAIVERAAAGVPSSPPVPDVREHDGWVYSSLPLGVVEEDGALAVERLRQTVSPEGRLEEARDRVRLRALSATGLEAAAERAGLRPDGREAIEATAMHSGSIVVRMRAGDG